MSEANEATGGGFDGVRHEASGGDGKRRRFLLATTRMNNER